MTQPYRRSVVPAIPSRRVALWAMILAAGTMVPSTAVAQADNDVLFDTTGMKLFCELFGDCFPDQSRDSQNNPLPPGSPQFIVPATGYHYHLDGTVLTSGLVGGIIPSGSTLGEMLDILDPGQSRLLDGYVRNPSGTLPNPHNSIWLQTYADNIFGIDLGLTLDLSITDTGVGVFEIRNIDIPLGIVFGTLEINPGSALIETWTPSPRQETEWHFDTDLSSVSGSGPSEIRYLDDPAFGTILGGIGNEDTPNPSNPTGVTQAQSSFTTTDALGIAGPGGSNDAVYVTSPARNLSDPNPDFYRGIGLTLYPKTQPTYPGTYFGQWTMIFDLYIPSSSWNTEWPVALINGTQNNEGPADCLIRNPGNGNGSIGFAVNPGSYLQTPLIGPDRWMRIALVGNLMQTGQTRVYVDGTYIGSTGSDWFYNSVDPTNPLYGDGEPVDPTDWQNWGNFPSPWAMSSGTFPGSTGPTPLASSLGLFCDLGDSDLGPGGRSEVVYLANLYFADDLLSDAEISALGGADAAGIVFTTTPCPPDFNNDGQVNTQDFIAFLNAWTAGDPRADFNEDGTINTQDFIAFLNAWTAGC